MLLESNKLKIPSGEDDWRKIDKNNRTVVLNVLYVKKMNIHPAYISKTIEIMKIKSFF